MLIELGRYQEAIHRLGELDAADQASASCEFLRAQALLGLERTEEALAAADLGLARAPDSEWGHRIRAATLGRLGRQADALVAAQEAVRVAPHEFRCHLSLASAATNARRYWLAGEAADTALRLSPTSADAHAAAGSVALATGNNDAAREHFLAALAIDPQHAGARNALGVADLREQRTAEAIGHFQAAARVNPVGPSGANLDQAIKLDRALRNPLRMGPPPAPVANVGTRFTLLSVGLGLITVLLFWGPQVRSTLQNPVIVALLVTSLLVVLVTAFHRASSRRA